MENFLVDLVDGEVAGSQWQKTRVYLCDFNLAHMISRGPPTIEEVGTLVTISPEMVCNELHSTKTDCWSLGVILYELLTRELPFYSPEED